MNRRGFLIGAGALITGTVILPRLGGRRGEPEAGTLIQVAPPAATLVQVAPTPRPAPPRTVVFPVAPYVAELATLTGARPVAPSFGSWLAGLDGADRVFLEGLRDKLADGKFTDYGASQVFDQDGLFFFSVGNSDLLNNCTPMVRLGADGKLAKGPMVEAPLAIGLTLMGRAWQGQGGVTPAAALLPREVVVDEGMSLQNTLPKAPYVYRTEVGSLDFTYRSDSGAGTGTISLTARQSSGEVLLARDFPITWG